MLGVTLAYAVAPGASTAVVHPAASAEQPRETVDFTEVSYIDALLMDVVVGYRCAMGAARAVSAVVERTKPAPQGVRELVTSSAYSESIPATERHCRQPCI